jgi:hypothetical protein
MVSENKKMYKCYTKYQHGKRNFMLNTLWEQKIKKI